jgi:hypothetical protein
MLASIRTKTPSGAGFDVVEAEIVVRVQSPGFVGLSHISHSRLILQ